MRTKCTMDTEESKETIWVMIAGENRKYAIKINRILEIEYKRRRGIPFQLRKKVKNNRDYAFRRMLL